MPVFTTKTGIFIVISYDMRNKNIWPVLFWAVMFATLSCARRGVPTGGPKDTIPPNVLATTPTLETVNFDDDEIIIEFDEFIEARSLKQDIIINPSISEYDFYVNRRTLFIELQEDLRENTTYTFNFRDAVKDVSEQNPAENVVLAFSTGSTIDSLSVQGEIRDLLTNQPAEEILVALYEEGDTLNPYEDPPLYLTKTDEQGRYRIRYIKTGTYNIFAYRDSNNNLKIDSDSEALSFKAEPVLLLPEEVDTLAVSDTLTIRGDSLQDVRVYGEDIDLYLFRQDIRPIEIQSARSIGKYFDIKLNKSVKDYALSIDSSDVKNSTYTYLDSLNPELPENDRRILYSNFQDQQKNLRIYRSIQQDSLRTFLTVIDSVDQEKKDTLFIKFTESKRKPEELTQKAVTQQKITDTISMDITFNKPMIRVNTDSVLLSYDTLFYLPLDYERLFEWNERLDQVSIKTAVNRNQLADTIINYRERSDSVTFYDRLEKKQAYLDSIRQTEEVEAAVDYFGELSRLRAELSPLNDSLQKIEEKPLQLELIKNVVDTLSLSETYQGINYQKEDILEGMKQLIFYIAPASFISIEMDSSEQILQRYAFKQPENFGNISGRIDTEYTSYTLQLLDNNYNVVRESGPAESYSFELVPPGDYYLRVLIDADGDGQWERGNILENEEPEPVYFYTEEEMVNLRANWFREIDLNF
jgi:uncharacterized protein (DUF2141 family)